MSQAESKSINPEVPPNLLVNHNPIDTFTNCSHVLTLICSSAAAGSGAMGGDEEADGFVLIMHHVIKALDYEVERLHAVARG